LQAFVPKNTEAYSRYFSTWYGSQLLICDVTGLTVLEALCIKTSPGMQEIFKSAKAIVSFYSHSTKATGKLTVINSKL